MKRVSEPEIKKIMERYKEAGNNPGFWPESIIYYRMARDLLAAREAMQEAIINNSILPLHRFFNEMSSENVKS